MMRNKLTLVFVAILIAAVMSPGCNWIGPMLSFVMPDNSTITIPPEYDDLSGKVAVMIVFEPGLEMGYPLLRRQLAGTIGAQITEHIDDTEKVPVGRVIRHQNENEQWRTDDRVEIGKKLEADFLLVVTLREYRMSPPGSSGLFSGSIQGDCALFKIDSPDGRHRVWRNDNVSVMYPDGGRPVERFDGDVRELRYKTDKRFAEALVKKFRKYKVTK